MISQVHDPIALLTNVRSIVTAIRIAIQMCLRLGMPIMMTIAPKIILGKNLNLLQSVSITGIFTSTTQGWE